MARKSADIKEQGGLGECALHLEEAFEELVNEGLIEKEKLDSFNIPFYGPTMDELQSVVETEKSFEIESMRLLSGFPQHPTLEVREGEEEIFGEVREGEEEMFGRAVGNFYRSLSENIVGTHLGSDEHLVDDFFSRIAHTAAAKYGEFLSITHDVAVVFLVRKELDSV